MNPLVQFRLPIKGMGEGMHHFQFSIDQSFFRSFEDSPVQDGNIDLKLELDKRPGLYVLQFDFDGLVATECDRCLANINLPINGSQRLLIKLAEEDKLEEAEVVYIHPEDSSLDVSRFIYEFVVLAIPMIKVYDCEDESPKPCNDQMLGYLEQKEEEQGSNPIWDDLKKLNINQG